MPFYSPLFSFAVQEFENPKTKWKFKTDGPIRGSAVTSGKNIYFGSSDGNLYAVDKADGTLAWKYQTEGAITGAPAVNKTTAFISSRDNKIYAVDINSGNLKWSYQMQSILPDNHAGWDYFMAAPVVSENQVYVGSGDGHIYSLDISSGDLNWKFKTNGRIRATPLLHEGIIYQPSNDGYIYVLNAGDGKLLWTFETRGVTYNPADFSFDRSSIFTKSVIVDDLLVFGSRDGNVYAVNLNTHEEVWSFTTGTTWAMSVSVSDGVVYAGWSTNNLFNAIDLETGEEIWQFVADSHVYTKALVLNTGVFIGSADGNIYKLNKDTGEKAWGYPVGSEGHSSPFYDSNTLFFGNDE